MTRFPKTRNSQTGFRYIFIRHQKESCAVRFFIGAMHDVKMKARLKVNARLFLVFGDKSSTRTCSIPGFLQLCNVTSLKTCLVMKTTGHFAGFKYKCSLETQDWVFSIKHLGAWYIGSWLVAGAHFLFCSYRNGKRSVQIVPANCASVLLYYLCKYTVGILPSHDYAPQQTKTKQWSCPIWP